MLILWMRVSKENAEGLTAALREANQQFYRRFSYMEEVCRQRGVSMDTLSFDEQNALWEEAKKKGEE